MKKSVSETMGEDLQDESRLVARLKIGDEAAFAILVRRFQAKLYGLAYALTLERDESRDIVQEAFLKAFRNIGRFREEAKLATWLHRITVNECLNWRRAWIRRLRRHHRSLDDSGPQLAPEPADDDTPENRYSEKELQQKFEAALQALPSKARTVFVLKELEGRSYEEIADTLRVSRGTVSSRLHYARKYLRKSLESHHGGEQP